MPTGTSFNPIHTADFDKSKMIKAAQGISGSALAGQNTNLDLSFADDILMTGAVLLAKGAAQGDTVSFQVVLPDGVTVAAQFVTNWFINPDVTLQETPQSNYPAKIPAGFILRLIYTSVGSTNVWVAINLNSEKVLV